MSERPTERRGVFSFGAIFGALIVGPIFAVVLILLAVDRWLREMIRRDLVQFGLDREERGPIDRLRGRQDERRA